MSRPTKPQLTAWRKARGLSRREFARIMGVRLRTVRAWEQAGPNQIPEAKWELAVIKLTKIVV